MFVCFISQSTAQFRFQPLCSKAVSPLKHEQFGSPLFIIFAKGLSGFCHHLRQARSSGHCSPFDNSAHHPKKGLIPLLPPSGGCPKTFFMSCASPLLHAACDPPCVNTLAIGDELGDICLVPFGYFLEHHTSVQASGPLPLELPGSR